MIACKMKYLGLSDDGLRILDSETRQIVHDINLDTEFMMVLADDVKDAVRKFSKQIMAHPKLKQIFTFVVFSFYYDAVVNYTFGFDHINVDASKLFEVDLDIKRG